MNSQAKATVRWPRWFRVSAQAGVPRFEITAYSEHALSAGEEAAAIAYIQIKPPMAKSAGARAWTRTSNSPRSAQC